MWSRSSERWSVKEKLSSKSWWWVECLGAPRKNPIPNSIIGQTYQNLCVPGWQEVLPVGAGQQRDGIQQGLQFQCQCWCNQPSYQGEWSPVQKLRGWWTGGLWCSLVCEQTCSVINTHVKCLNGKDSQIKTGFAVLGTKCALSNYRLCKAKNTLSADVVVKRKDVSWKK